MKLVLPSGNVESQQPSLQSINGLAVEVKKCGKTRDLQRGRLLHRYLMQAGCHKNRNIAATLITMYSKCSSMQDAQNVFHCLTSRDVVLWTVLIVGYVENGKYLVALDVFGRMDCEPDGVTFVAALKACVKLASSDKEVCLAEGSAIHRQARECGLDTDKFVGSSLVEMYSKCGRTICAREVFDRVRHRDVVTWTTLVAGFVENGESLLALDVFNAMDCVPNAVTFVSALKACVILANECKLDKETCLVKGLDIHRRARECGFDGELFLANTLIELYSKCGSMERAREVFDRMPQRNVVTWTVLIQGYVENGESLLALTTFKTMSCSPDRLTFAAAAKACGSLATSGELDKKTCLEEGLAIHRKSREFGTDRDVFVSNRLVDMFSKCGDMVHARQAFDQMTRRDVVSWTSLIVGYTENGESSLALDVFDSMDCTPDGVTLAAALKACAGLSTDRKTGKETCLAKGLWIHEYLIKNGLDTEMFIASSLIDMYGRCEDMLRAREVFEGMAERSVVSWNVLILGYLDNGESLLALEMFDTMDSSPDTITFVAALRACASLGALELGQGIVDHIRELQLDRNDMLATCLVDFYAKCGNMDAAEKAFNKMDSRGTVAWNALVGGYALIGDTSKVFGLVEKMKEASVQMDGVTMLLILTACSHGGLAGEGYECFESMSTKYGISPTVEHFTCMVDMLGRMNRLQEAWSLLERMPFEGKNVAWMALLAACKKWNDIEIGKGAFQALVSQKQRQGVMTDLDIHEKTLFTGSTEQPTFWCDPEGKIHSFVVDVGG